MPSRSHSTFYSCLLVLSSLYTHTSIYMYISIYIYVYICIYICMYIHIYGKVNTFLLQHIFTLSLLSHIEAKEHMNTHKYSHTHTHIYIYIYIHIYTIELKFVCVGVCIYITYAVSTMHIETETIHILKYIRSNIHP